MKHRCVRSQAFYSKTTYSLFEHILVFFKAFQRRGWVTFPIHHSLLQSPHISIHHRRYSPRTDVNNNPPLQRHCGSKISRDKALNATRYLFQNDEVLWKNYLLSGRQRWTMIFKTYPRNNKSSLRCMKCLTFWIYFLEIF